MRLPRNLSGNDLAGLLRRHYGYRLIRQRGSHMTVTAIIRDAEHQVTIPRHRHLRVGTLSSIISDVAEQLGVTQDEVRRELFGP
jgi:predicted RNA binding protein YcfA (HicA-like mRNA interferase family)